MAFSDCLLPNVNSGRQSEYRLYFVVSINKRRETQLQRYSLQRQKHFTVQGFTNLACLHGLYFQIFFMSQSSYIYSLIDEIKTYQIICGTCSAVERTTIQIRGLEENIIIPNTKCQRQRRII